MRLLRLHAISIALLCLAGSLRAVTVRSVEVITLGRSQVNATRLLARIKPENLTGTGRDEVNAVIQTAGMRVRRDFALVPGLLYLEMSGAHADLSLVVTPETRADHLLNTLQTLRDSALFSYAEPDFVVNALEIPTDSKFTDGTLWGLLNTGQDGGVEGADVNAARAWAITTGSPDSIVADIDTGVRYDHVDLAPNMWVNPGEIPDNGIDDDGNGVIDDVHGFNAVGSNGNPFDDNGHGTHTSGTIAAAGNNGFPHVGVAFNSKIVACKFLHAEGFGFDGDAIDCINYCVKMGIKVSNNSWGGGDFSQSTSDAIRAAGDKGHLFIAAAGNNGTDNDLDPVYPGSYQLDNVIAVAAIDRKDRLADFSCFGRNSVHLGAPGVDIYSTLNDTTEAYGVESGTSMATPHVVGVAALIRAAFPTASLAEVRDRIVYTTAPTAALKDTTRTGGRVDAYAALQATADGIIDLALTPTPGTRFLVGTTNLFVVRVSDIAIITNASQVKADLLYPDGTAGSATFVDDGKGSPDKFSLDGLYSARIGVKTNPGPFRLTFTVKAPGKKDPTNNVFNYLIVNRPDNDQFAKPEKIASTGGTVRSTLDYATREPGEPNHAGEANLGGSFWYSWSPLATGTALIEDYGSVARTVVSIYTGSVLAQLKSIASITNEIGKRNGALVIPVIGGETYRIAVSGLNSSETGEFRLRVVPNGTPDKTAPVVIVTSPLNAIAVGTNSILVSGTSIDQGAAASGVKAILVRVNGGLSSNASGTTNWGAKADLQLGINIIEVRGQDLAENVSDPIRLTIDYRPTPVGNDFLATAQRLSGPGDLIQMNTDGATREQGEPNHAGNRGGKSVWFSYSASDPGILSLTTSGSTFDTILAVYTGNFYTDLKLVTANDDASKGSRFSRVVVSVIPGVEYKIAVDGFAGVGGNLKLAYTFDKSKVYSAKFTAGPGGNVDSAGGSFPPGTSLSVLAIPAPDMEFVQWRGTFDSYQNPLNITVTEDLTLEAVFQPIRFTDDFESGNLTSLTWNTTGAKPWAVQNELASRGKFSARSGAIGDSQETVLTLEASLRPGTGSFDLRVSSEEGWDVLEFSMDGEVLGTWSGEVGWQTFFFNATAGKHKLVWRYSKDNARSAGRDAAFIDSVKLPVRAPVSSNSKPSLSFAESAGGINYYRIDGQIDQLYVLEGSQNFRTWTPVVTAANENGFIIVLDDRAKDFNYRFYRAVVAPTQ